MKDGVLMQKYYGEDGTVTHHQIKIPKHIVPELLSSLHGKTNKHPRSPRSYKSAEPNTIIRD